jgi:multidrug resistance efflux pump
MKKAIILCFIVLCIGCESDKGSTQSVMQIVQTEKLKTQIRQLNATIEAQEAEIKQLRTKNADQEALHSEINRLQATVEAQQAETERLKAENKNQQAQHLEQTAKLNAQIRQLQATIDEQKIEMEQTETVDTEEK